MNISVGGNVRAAEGARIGLNEALALAFRGGAITGLLVVGLGLLGVAGYYAVMAASAAPGAAFREVLNPPAGLGFAGSPHPVFPGAGAATFPYTTGCWPLFSTQAAPSQHPSQR